MFDIAHIGDAIAVKRSMALPGREAVAVNEVHRAARRALENPYACLDRHPARAAQDARRTFAHPRWRGAFLRELAAVIGDRADIGEGELR
jgi:hypothetical protein